MIAEDAKQLVQSYIASFQAEDPAQCAAFYTDDAALHFMMGVYRGKAMIADWHRERFEAAMKVLEVNKVVERGDEVTCEFLIESKRLKAWRINTLRGKAAFRLRDGKIDEVHFSLAGGNPLEGWQ
jgi:ketosteroid isomerase-like protein